MSPHSLRSEPLLALHEVTVQFGAVVAVSGVSVEVGERDFVGLIGPNGAGKTTLFNVVSGFVRPTSGIVEFAGRDVTRWSPTKRARGGLVRTFQNVGLNKTATVRENLLAATTTGRVGVELGDLMKPSERRHGATAQLDETVGHFGLGAYLDVKVRDLSTGIAKMVELSCAMLRKPRLLLLDEPSSGLSPDETDRLGEMLDDLHRHSEVAILMIEHDIPLIMRTAKYIHCLDFGEQIASGDPHSVRNNRVVIDAYLGEAS